ncbi:MAG: hypothetical protein RhofKO_24000 [Rhodothermales bacterium]
MKPAAFLTSTVVLFGLSFMHTAHAQQCEPASESLIREITQIWSGHVEGHFNLDVEAASDLYAHEMVWRSPEGIAPMTKEGLVQSYHDWYARLESEGGRLLDLSYVTDQALSCGDVVLELGHWTVKTGTEATPKVDNWEHSVIWMRDSAGALKIQSVINWKMST